MSIRQMIIACTCVIATVLLCVSALAQPAGKEHEEKERKVKESEVPAAAMAGLKKASGQDKFDQIEEEIEDGHKFYEGQWKGPNGRIEALVTEFGDLVEIEEHVSPDKVPAAVRVAAEKDSGKDATVMWEKKTAFTYEVHFKKGGKHHEMLFAPTGAQVHEDGDNGESKKDEDD